jgi:cytochrome c5
MAEAHIEEHYSPIKTPQQLVVVVLLSFIVPVAIIILLVKLITGSMNIDPDSNAMSEEAIASRLKPVGEVSVVAAADTASGGASVGEALFNSVCQACHAAGVAGAPKTGDPAAWKTRLAQGLDTLYSNAIQGKNAMPPKGGAMSASDDEVRAAVDILLAKSK